MEIFDLLSSQMIFDSNDKNYFVLPLVTRFLSFRVFAALKSPLKATGFG